MQKARAAAMAGLKRNFARNTMNYNTTKVQIPNYVEQCNLKKLMMPTTQDCLTRHYRKNVPAPGKTKNFHNSLPDCNIITNPPPKNKKDKKVVAPYSRMLKKHGRVHEAQLEDDLIMLGMHMGHDKYFENPYVRRALLGYRNDFALFDVRQTAWSLRRTTNFLREASFNTATSLFYYSQLTKMSEAYQKFVFHLMQREKQSYLVRWNPGTLTNFVATTQSFVKKIEDPNTPLSKDVSSLELFIRVLHKTALLQSGQRTSIISVRSSAKRHPNIKLWKLYRFFKTYRHFYQLPDLLITISPEGNRYPIEEAKILRIPVVSIVDSNLPADGVTYPIYGNDDSPLAVLFFFQLYMNAYKLGRMDRYLLFKDLRDAIREEEQVSTIERLRDSDLAIPALV